MSAFDPNVTKKSEPPPAARIIRNGARAAQSSYLNDSFSLVR
jgi:hypothetical protein